MKAELSGESHFRSVFGSWQPRGVVFDCDGLLMDTESLWIETQRLVCERWGIEFDADLKRQLVGMPASRIGPLIAEIVGLDPHRVVEDLLSANERMVRRSAMPMPGAKGLVEAIASKVPVAVASNSARRILDETLSRGPFEDSFSVCLSADDVRNPKPEPDVYLATAAALGLQPENCLAFEDSETGATAALSAGLKVIAVPSVPDQRPSAHAACTTLASVELLEWVASWT